MAIYGYQRVSTAEQNLARQTQALIAYGIAPEDVYTDKESGGKMHRKALDELLSKVEGGDTVVVLSFDRLARSVSQLLAISEDFAERGINLVSIKENIDTTTACGKLFFTVTAAFAEFEKSMNNERTKQGLAAAKRNGINLGRPKVETGKIEEAMRLYRDGSMTVAQISKAVGISESSVYRAARAAGLRKGR